MELATPAPDRSFALLKHASKLLIQHMDDNLSVVLSGWSLTESKLAPMEWASLLNLSKDLQPLLLQPTKQALERAPSQSKCRERQSLFGFLKQALAQLDPAFINFDGDSFVMEKVLSAYGLDSDNLTLLDGK